MAAFNAIDRNHDGYITRQEWNAAIGKPVDSMAGSTTAVSYGAPYVSSAVPTTMVSSPITYQVPSAGSMELAPAYTVADQSHFTAYRPVSTGASVEVPIATYSAAPSTTYQVSEMPMPTYSTVPTTYQVSTGASVEVPMHTYAAAPTTTYQVSSVAAQPVTYGGSISVPPVTPPPVYAAPMPVTYTAPASYMSGTTEIRGSSVSVAPAQYVSSTTDIRGGSVSVAPAVYTSVSGTDMRGGSVSVAPAVYTTAPASPVVSYAAPPTPIGGGSISMQPRGSSVTVMQGGSVEVPPAVKYVGSSVSYPAAPAPAPVVTAAYAAPTVTNAYAAPTKVERFVSAPMVTQLQAAPVPVMTAAPVVAAPPLTMATVPPVTTVTAPPVTTATVMAPLPTKVCTAPTATTYVSQQPGLVQTVANAAFEAMDRNHDGVITRAEFNNAMSMMR